MITHLVWAFRRLFSPSMDIGNLILRVDFEEARDHVSRSLSFGRASVCEASVGGMLFGEAVEGVRVILVGEAVKSVDVKGVCVIDVR
jgi:hypothetical protein